MKFTTKDLDWAVDQKVIAPEVRTALVEALDKRYENRPTLSAANVLYYLGGLIVIASMTLYITLAWENIGPLGHLAVAVVYGTVFFLSGHWLWQSPAHRIPGGILLTAAVCMTPMAVHAIQQMSGWWGVGYPGEYRDFYLWIRSGWAFMELATIAAGLAVLHFYRFPFLTLPVAFCLWFMSMDLTAMLYGPDFSWQQRKLVSLWFGLAMLVASYIVDRRTREDFAFWGYLFGLLAFWGGLTTLESYSELGKFGYCCINLLLMVVSVVLQRRVFIVFGALGVTSYLGHLAHEVFKDQIVFTFSLSAFGLGVIALGLVYHKHRAAIERRMVGLLPQAVRRTLPRYRKP